MKNYNLILAFVLLSTFISESFCQTYLISQEGTVTTCSGNFYDSGGLTGNYSSDEDYSIVFKSTSSGAILQFVFNSFTLESNGSCNKDYLRIYDGENVSAPQIGEYCGSNSPGTVISTNSAGALTFVFHSNGTKNYAGWSASISCSIPPNLGLWTGTTSSDWDTPSNWYNNAVPIASSNVTIPSSASNWPTYSGDLALGTTCNNIIMDGSSELTVTGNLTIANGTSFTCIESPIIHIGANFVKNGTFDYGISTVDFYGNTTSEISGSAGEFDIFYDGFENNTGWSLSGEFEIAVPQGLGGSVGNPDPSSSFAGLNVLGTDLTGLGSNAGDYEPNLNDREYQAISPIINCEGFANINLNFQRWLGVQNTNQDRVYIDISDDNGASWTQIWTNNSAYSESSWSQETIDISGTADDQSQVKIRFCNGVTNHNRQYCGWNIDELQITGSVNSLVTFHNLTVSKANAELISNAHISVTNDAVIKSDAYMTNSTDKALNVGGDVLLEANAGGMASYIDNGTTSVYGTTNVQQFISSERWHLISPPVSGAAIDVYFDIYLKEYNEPTDTWTYLVEPTTIPMNVAQGYSTWASDDYTGPTTVSYTGTLNNSDVVLTSLDYTVGAPKEGFNLVGNPFPCALDWNSNWNMVNMSGWMVIYDNGVYRGIHTDGTPYNGKTDGIIPSTQGFWVRALNTSASLTIPASERLHSSQVFYKESTEIIHPLVRLEININGYSDETTIVFHPNATDGFDGFFDLAKFDNVEEAPQLFTIAPDGNLAVNFYGSDYQEKIIPLGFRTAEAGLYTINASSIENFDGNISIYLEDLVTGSFTMLTDTPQYEFVYNPQDEEHRFNLHFTSQSMAINEAVPHKILIYSTDEVVFIKNPELHRGDVVIYNMIGQKVYEGVLQSKTTKVYIKNRTGYYIVKVRTEDNLYTEKVFIR